MPWASTSTLEEYASPSDLASLQALIAGSATWVAAVLGEAQEQIDPCRYSPGARQLQAHALLTLHLIASAGELPSGGLSGVLASEANGPASRSFAVTAPAAQPDEALYASTPYGRRFLAMRRFAGALAGVSSNTCYGGGCG